MTLDSLDFAGLFLVSSVIAFILTGLMRKLALKLGIFDRPNQSHKTHSEPVPYLGGLAVLLTIDGILVFGTYMLDTDSVTRLTLLSIIAPATLMGILGLIDDIRHLSPISKLIAQSITGVFTAFVITSTDTIGNPFDSEFLNICITILWIVGITNAVNFFDNIDGGAAGFIIISSLGLFFLSLQNNQNYIAALAILLAGSTLGFLYWNWNPARIYLGDAGSLFLGVLISATLVRFEPSTTNQLSGYVITFLLVALIVLDTTVVISSRLVRRLSPLKGGRDHLSHRLLSLGLTREKSVLTLWSIQSIFALCALVIANSSEPIQKTWIWVSILVWLFTLVYFFRLPINRQLGNRLSDA